MWFLNFCEQILFCLYIYDQIFFENVEVEENVADLLTKFIAVEVLKKLRGLMGMRSISFPLAKRLLVHLFIKKKIRKKYHSFAINIFCLLVLTILFFSFFERNPPFLMSKGIGNSELAYKVNKGG